MLLEHEHTHRTLKWKKKYRREENEMSKWLRTMEMIMVKRQQLSNTGDNENGIEEFFLCDIYTGERQTSKF